MDLRFGIVFLLVVGVAWDCDARNLASFDSELSYLKQGKDVEALSEASSKPKVCELCESLVSQAVEYLAENQTQSEIIRILRQTCAVVGLFKEECVSLVDSYVPLFFSEASSIEPASICQSVRFCEQVTVEILQALLNICDSLGKRAKECKKLVFEYGPLILANSEKILEQTDICKAIHACPGIAGGDKAISSVGTVSSLADA
ncbi:Proactivator polypeptide-like 1 [Cucurbita argyrosperma subsp. argyrosperma]|nr:Proactivator polypeptide-like 1 [Cucurbita argyrosperma subsp. argyrosperma]